MSEPDNLLSELLAEEFTELRWRRDIEDRLVRWTISICSLVITGSLGLAKFASKGLFMTFTVFAASLIVGFGIRICDKIEAENKAYKGVGRTIVRILSNKHQFEKKEGSKTYIGKDIKNIGQGEGYKKTQEIVRFTTYCSGLALIALGLAKLIISTK